MIKKYTNLVYCRKKLVLIQYYINLLFLKEVKYPRKNSNLSSCFSKPKTWWLLLVLLGCDPEDKVEIVSFQPGLWSPSSPGFGVECITALKRGCSLASLLQITSWPWRKSPSSWRKSWRPYKEWVLLLLISFSVPLCWALPWGRPSRSIT